MWATALKLVPFRDWLYAAVAIGAIVFYNTHVHNLIVADEHKRDSAVALESARVQTAALAREAQDAADYTAKLKKANDRYVQKIHDSDVAHAADMQRLRQLAAAQGGSGSSLGGAAGSGAPANSGGSSLIGLGYVSAELAAALRDARSDLSACYDERDSLTGK